MNTLTTFNKEHLMSSDSIAKLLNKTDGNVRRTMQTLEDKGLISITQFEKLGEINGLGYQSKKIIYHVNERDSYIVVAQLSPEFTAFLVDEWQSRKSPKPVTQEDQLLMLAQGVIKLTAERDEAIKTKTHINDKRTATVMGKLGAATKKIKSLESKLQDVGLHLSFKAAKLPERIDTEFKANVQTWRVLKQLAADMSLPIKKVSDDNYGEVNTYHVDVIEAFKEEYL